MPKFTDFREALIAALRVSLFFFVGFLLLGKPLGLSLFLGTLGGLGAGWLVAGWKNKEIPPQRSTPEPKTVDRPKLEKEPDRQGQKKQPRRSRKSIFPWKNPRPSKKSRR